MQPLQPTTQERHDVPPASRCDNDNNDSVDDDVRHFFCYLLESCDPRHPQRTYIGKTTDPIRRLKQHNGEMSGGAYRTKIGRPFRFAAVVHGFSSERSALQFEWCWQHSNRSLVARRNLGDENARKLSRRRGAVGRIAILHKLLAFCVHDIISDGSCLTVFFFDAKHQAHMLRLANNEREPFPHDINLVVVEKISELPSSSKAAKTKRKKRKAVGAQCHDNHDDKENNSSNTSNAPNDGTSICKNPTETFICTWCHQSICNQSVQQGDAHECEYCGEMLHKDCAEIVSDSAHPICPSCRVPFVLGDDDGDCGSEVSSNEDDCTWCLRAVSKDSVRVGDCSECPYCGELMHADCARMVSKSLEPACPSCKAPFIEDDANNMGRNVWDETLHQCCFSDGILLLGVKEA